MSNYTKSTNFATKDNLTPGDPLKIVRGTEIDTEFNNIATAIATKTDNASAAITGGSITGITDLAIADGGTGASTATAAINNLLPSQTSNANKYLQTDGTNVSWDAVSLSTADITGTLPVANGGTGVTSSTGTGSVVLSNSPTLVTPALGTPASGVATNLTGLPLTTGVTGTLPIANGGTGQTTANAAFNALAPSQATASGKYLKSDGTNTSWDALDISTADITGTLPVANGGTGVTTSTGTGSVVLSNSPTLVTPALGTPSSATLTNATGLPISTGVSGLGTGVATALAVNVGSAGAPVVNGGALGTPSSGTVTNLTGTASININGTVGATTPTTGAFTTTTISSSETLSYGTANGVTYLNGSKVLTSGSALNFNGTSLAVGDAASSADGSSLYIYGNLPASTQLGIKIGGNANSYAQQAIRFYDTYFGAYAGFLGFTTNSLTFGQGTSEGMRLTSTGLGIGTSSPAYKLDVNQAAVGFPGFRISGSNSPGMQIAETSGTVTSHFVNDSAGCYFGTTTSHPLVFRTVNTERMRLDTSGNLGIGTSSPAGKLDIYQNSSRYVRAYPSSGLADFEVVTNNNVQPVFAVKGTGTADLIRAYAGATQAMTLDASGNLGVITTSPTSFLSNWNGLAVGTTSGSNGIAIVSGTASPGTLAFADGTSGADQYRGYIQYNHSTNSLLFGTDATERARIDSSGNLLVGTTSQPPSGTNKTVIQVDGSGNPGLNVYYTGTGAYNQIVLENGNGVVGRIQTSGSATSYLTSSDYRMKNSIAPMTGALAKVAQLKPVTYKWKVDGSDGQGFIAHELAEVVPDCVSGEKDAVDADGNPKYQGIDTSFLVATLTAAIQEQQAIIESLKARLDAANL